MAFPLWRTLSKMTRKIFLTEDDLKWLKAMDCAFSKKVHNA